jgi:hypothetical protein
MRRYLIWSAVLLQFVLVAFGAWVLYNRHRVARAAAEAVTELDRTEPGWRLRDIEAARAAVPEEENSARVVVAVRRLLPRGWPPQQLSDALNSLPPPQRLTPQQAALLEAQLQAVAPAVAEARKLAGLPRGRHHNPFRRKVSEPLRDDQMEARTVAALLKYDALRRAHAGDLGGALTSCRGVLNAGRSIGDEPIIISQLVRIAGVGLACSAAERVLAQGEAGPEDLGALQRAFEEEDRHPGLLISLRGERAAQYELYDALEKGQIKLEDMTEQPGMPPGEGPAVVGWVGRDRYRSKLPHDLSMLTRRIEACRLPPQEQIEVERQLKAEVEKRPREAPYLKPLLAWLQRISEAERRRQALVRCMAVTLAVERYRQHGDWPKSLAQLTPELLKEVPLDPFDGRPLRYRRLADGVVIWSVGLDGKDNGGRLYNGALDFEGKDLGFRLWDVRHRRRPPQPAPAPAEGHRRRAGLGAGAAGGLSTGWYAGRQAVPGSG